MYDQRFQYLVKTLSRTKRKDYENYVINAIWNRLDDVTIKPASQWFVKSDNGWHLIDLYFPQINFGIECDEGYHKKNDANDKRRELTLIEVLSAVDQYGYEAFHIDVTRPLAEIEQRIDECAVRIKGLVGQRRLSGDFIEWVDVDLSKRFHNNHLISAADDILFPTIASVVNSLMRLSKKAYQRGYFTPEGLDPQYKFWFPQLEVDGQSQAFGWHNSLSQDGMIITEYNEDVDKNLSSWKKRGLESSLDFTRVTFAKVQDPVTGTRSYRFVGVFILRDIGDNDRRTYIRVSDRFDATRHLRA